MNVLLDVRGLTVSIPTTGAAVEALRGVDLTVRAGEVVGLVGESGGGKSMLARATIGMLPARAQTGGDVLFRDQDVLGMSEAQLLEHRGHGVALCFQNPRAALEPLRTVQKQLADRLRLHQGSTGQEATAESVRLLEAVGITDTRRVLGSYPHELSGGMAQRVMIALCLACDPGLLLADEPTTGLDVTLTRDALALLRSLAVEQGRGVLLISHDIAAAVEVCDRIVVLRAGEVVEEGTTAQVLESPRSEYTRTLLAAVPDIDRPLTRRAAGPVRPEDGPGGVVAEVRDAHVRYRGRIGSGGHHALRGVDLTVHRGETVGIVGESGSGKTTLARMLVGLVKPSSGRVEVAGHDLAALRGSRRRALRRSVQMVFQDPLGALDPRRTVLDAVTETLLAQGVDRPRREQRATEVLRRTGLDETFLTRLPHELSGGQAQRVGIARALVCEPELIVFDEPTSALDVTVQAQILDLITELGADGERGQLFVSHDLATVRSFCDRVVVIYRGEVVEEGPTAEVFDSPQHPYTRRLLAAAPRLGGRAVTP
ncbi:ABC transporter ATP-binding protein [Herbiconiux sp. CPCC 203407]|uniref:ABC transporter ATP-binding protein n=1 Tax=Herbiconiux oxytropis TaxID=2970915 RepID=A0AA41XGM5_9MICO|nr:ABC transporter ATP-binding protein [Herbiconiux oxytropis]MCS5722876.1 ABC transporter ATP-binding protein [Herbiconiux oxytropis]MCS5725864.1 ABC transporter ATP-binding protein [Herbiconiux oxytropis]